jgi:hypothetical protein
MQKAFIEGRTAGRLRLAAALNPYGLGSEEAAAWERGRCSALAEEHAMGIRAA